MSTGVILGADEIDLLILIANSPGRGVREGTLGSQQTWNHVVRTFAMFLNVPVVFCNRVGYEDGVAFWGGSQIVGPSGSVLAEAPDPRTDLDIGRDRPATRPAKDAPATHPDAAGPGRTAGDHHRRAGADSR